MKSEEVRFFGLQKNYMVYIKRVSLDEERRKVKKPTTGLYLNVNDRVGFRIFLSCSLKYEVLRIKRVYLDEEQAKQKSLPTGLYFA